MVTARLLTAAALAAGLLACAHSAAQPPVQPVRPPAGLPVVPASASAFVTLKVSELANHPDLKAALAELAKQPEALAGVSEAIGVSPFEIDRVTLFWPRFGRGDPVLVVTTAEPFNEARVLKNLKARPVFGDDFSRFGDHYEVVPRATKQAVPQFKSAEPIGPASPPPGAGPGEAPPPKRVEPGAPGKDDSDLSLCEARVNSDFTDPLCYEIGGGPFRGLFLVDERTLVFLPGRGDADFTMLALLGATLKKNATGPLAETLADAHKHTFAVGVHLTPLFKDLDRRVDPELAPYTALLAARTATVTGDLDKSAKLSLTLKFDDATSAKRAAPVLEEGMATVADRIAREAGELRDNNRPFDKATAPILSAFAAGLKKAAVKPEGATVLATAEVDAGAATAKALGDMLLAVQSRRKAELRMNNLKLIGIALHSYHDVNNRFPTNVYGPKGELLLSWRVHLLPFLEQDALYRQFKLDEPWDGPNNSKLIDKMPKVFQAPDREAEKGKTFYQGFAQREKLIPLKGQFGRPWLQDGDKQGLPIVSIYDGTSNTIAVVEAGEGVVWSKPSDLPFGGAVPRLGEKGWDRAPVLMFDGSTRLIPTNMKPEVFWPHVTINGGEVTVFPDDDRRSPFGRVPSRGAEPSVAATKEAVPTIEAPRAKDPAPIPLPPVGRLDPDEAAVKRALLLAQERTSAAQAEAAELVLRRLEMLADKGAVTDAEVLRAKAVYADALARLEATRREAQALEQQLKAAKEKAPRK